MGSTAAVRWPNTEAQRRYTSTFTPRVLLGLARVWKRAWPGSVVLILGVAAFWLAIVGVILVAVPVPEQANMLSPAYSVGELAHLRAPVGTPLRLPQELGTFKDLYQALWDDNGLAINEVLSRPGWIRTFDGQTVRIIDIYENGFQVELLDGPSAGAQAWAMLHHLGH